MKSKITIGIADDHILVRDGIVSILRSYPGITVVFEVDNGAKLLEKLKTQNLDILLLDIAMPEVDGIAALSVLRKFFPTVKTIVISGHSEPKSIIEYVKMGAVSFLPKNCDKATLMEAIFSVDKIGTFFEKNIHDLLSEHGLLPNVLIKKRKLSKNEQQVLNMLVDNKSMREIADLMNISLQAVGTYRHVIMRKTNTSDMKTLMEYVRNNVL